MARVLAVEIDGAMVRTALVQTSLRQLEVLRLFEIPLAEAVDLIEIEDTRASRGSHGGRSSSRPSEQEPSLESERGDSEGRTGDSTSTDPGPVASLEGEEGASAAIEIGDDDILDDTPEELRALRIALREAVELAQPSPDRLVTAMPGEVTSLRLVELPAVAERKIADVLPFELEAMVPFEIEDLVIDHQLVSRSEETVSVLAAAAPRWHVHDFLNVFQDLPIPVRELSAGAIALEGAVRACPEMDFSGTHAIVYLGASRLEFCVLTDGICRFSRTILRDKSVEPLGIKESEIRRTVMAFRGHGGAALERIYLTGDVSHSQEVAQLLADAGGCDVEPLRTELGSALDPELFSRSFFAISLAARLAQKKKRIDLRRGEFAARFAFGKAKKHIRKAAILLGAVALCWAFSTYAQWVVLGRENEALKDELRGLTSGVFGVEMDEVDQARNLLDEKKGAGGPLPSKDAFDIISVLSESVPSNIKHDVRRLQVSVGATDNPGQLELQGTVDSIAERDRIAEKLEKQGCFQELSRGKTSPVPGGSRLNYQVSAKVECKP